MRITVFALCAVLIAAALGLSPAPAAARPAETCLWTGAAGTGLWDTPGNWGCGHVPGATDTAEIHIATVTLTSNVNVGRLVLHSDVATLQGTAVDITINESLDWYSGVMAQTGRVTIPAGATLNIDLTDTGYHYLAAHLDNYGTVNWVNGATFHGYNGAVFTNMAGATFNVTTNATFLYSSYHGGAHPTFDNAGTVNVTNGATLGFGDTTIVVSRGVFNADAGATIIYDSRAVSLQPGTVMTGAGVNRTDLHTVATLQGTITSHNFQLYNGTAVLSGTGTISGTLLWTGGFMRGPGTIAIPAGSTLNIQTTGSKRLGVATLENAGTVNFNDTVSGYNGAVFRNLAGGTVNATTNVGFKWDSYYGGARPTFDNAGTVHVINGATLSFYDSAIVVSRGVFNADAGAAIIYDSTDFRLQPGTVMTGAGTNRTALHTVATLQGTITSHNFELYDGQSVLSGTGTISGTLLWTGGQLQGSGAITIPAGSTLNVDTLNGKLLNGPVLSNAGTVNFNTTGIQLIGYNGSAFNNLAGGTVNLVDGTRFTYGSGAGVAFHNAGMLRKTGGAGAAGFDDSFAFNNTGAVEVVTGTLNLNDGASTGAFNVAAGATLAFTRRTHALNDGATLTGAGRYWIDTGTLNFAGAVSVSNFEHTGGTVNLGSAALSITGDFMRGGSGTFNAGTSTVTFNGGTQQNLTLNNWITFNNLAVGPGTLLVETVATDYATVNGAFTNHGTIRKTLAIGNTGVYAFGLTGAVLDVTTPGTLSSVRVDWVGANHPYARIAQASGNYWSLTPTGSGYTVNLTLPHWLPVPAVAGLCRNAGGWAWDCGRTSSTAATITRDGVTQLGDWAVGYLNTWLLPPMMWR